VLKVDFSNPVPVTPPGSTTRLDFLAGITSQWRASEIPTSGALKPIVGPGIDYKINGLSLMQPQSGVGVTPTLSWNPPTIGSASYYVVSIFNLNQQTSAAIFLTTRTSLQVPPGLLNTGEAYLFWLSTYSWPGFDMAKPKALGWPYGKASLISEIVVP
jgi:hypothetical protein